MDNPITLLTLTAVAGITLIIGGLGPIARADSLLEPPSVVVHFEDLDIESPRGAELLYDRIKLAAETVCSDLGPQRPPSVRYATCLREALRAAIGEVNRPLLTEIAIAHGVVPSDAPIKVKVARTRPDRRPHF